MNKELIDYLVSHGGKLPDDVKWIEVADKFNIELPETKSNENLTPFERDRKRAKKTQDIWRMYLKTKEGLKLTKEIYENGKLKWETFKKVPEENHIKDVDKNFELERFTTNPHGGQWLKYKRKEQLFDDKHHQELKRILSEIIPPFLNYRVTPENEKALFIYGSDKHIGALTKENSIYTNKYDIDEMRKRIVHETLCVIEESVLQYGKMDSLYIMELGDALDGFDGKTTKGLKGHSSHSLPQQLNNREQHDVYVALHKELFDTIVAKGYAKDIYFIATSCSNHGGDFEYTAYKTLEVYLNLKYPFIKVSISTQFLNHFIYGDHCIIFSHGKDDEDMLKGLPLVLNDKVENYLNDYIRVNKLTEYNITVVSGDLHQAAETFGKNLRYKKVLSAYGGSKWIHTNFGSDAPGLSAELIEKKGSSIKKIDTFFNSEDKSNTGIKF
jgi:hypothetical protein